MKKKVIIFISLSLILLTIAPVINLNLDNKPTKVGQKWWSRSLLYNIDFGLPLLSRFLYPLGISTNPNQVIIGKNDWLYLGDLYGGKTITVTRQGASTKDVLIAKKIGLATKSWEQWLKNRGVQLYLIMIAADKSSIYPEYLPDWAQPNINSVTNNLMANVSQDIYVDTRPDLKAAKIDLEELLYFQTDTHWNSLGAWVALRALTKAIDLKGEGLHWLSDKQIQVTSVTDREGGDLARFLRMDEILLAKSSNVSIKIDSEKPIETEQYDFETGELKVSEGNPPVGAPKHPILVKSKHALNKKKVLWLRDSFGGAMSPFMAVTFSETLQLHYDVTNPKSFAKLVESYKPDYVFITVVERGARGKWFENLPPSNH